MFNLSLFRIIPEKATQNVIPLSEDELVKLKTKNQFSQEDASASFTDVPTIDKSDVSVEETSDLILSQPKKSEEKKYKLQVSM